MDKEINTAAVELDAAQYETIVGYMEQTQAQLEAVHASMLHYGMFLVLLVVFQLYGILSRARRKAVK